MQNVLTIVELLQPGDTWSEHTGQIYVIYKVEPSEEKFFTDVHAVEIHNGVTRNVVMRIMSHTRFVTDRPKS